MPLFIPAVIAALTSDVAIVCGEAFILAMLIAYRYYPVIHEVQFILTETGGVSSIERKAASEAIRAASSANMAAARKALVELDEAISHLSQGLADKVKQAIVESLKKLAGRRTSHIIRSTHAGTSTG
jgi:hypothetical protein